MKIGLVSIHSAHNYGSVLQAYALQEALKQYSKDVAIIDYRPAYFEKMYKIFSLSIYKDYGGFLSKLIHLAWRTIFLPSRIKKSNAFNRFIKDNYSLTKRFNNYAELKSIKNEFDVVFVGSDQVWNTDITEGFDKAYYLGFVGDRTIKASYAASIARATIDPKYLSQYKKYLARFDNISVREPAGKVELAKNLSQKITVSIDPTLLLERTIWDRLASQSRLNLSGKKYILTYILENNDELTKTVNYLSEKLDLPVISIGKVKRFKRETVIKDAGPADFLALFKNADAVVTNSFHGTVFSIIYRKMNFIIPHLATGGRMTELLKLLHLDDRIVYNFNQKKIDELISLPDFDSAQTYLDEKIKSAKNYLLNTIKKGEKNDQI